ncbi:thiol:disulfide interchange protein DsbG [Bordetella genomosp. 10]|uniref:Thiol:disulfide interchange protein n=1 Tax=Bordetella genomosp. 10 TaxID=1416804 RepID=A0A261RZK9_9BORD|nr:thiol:disulfide interchange protein DsbG [Bordetella genomosp. 10]OZI30092.1 thiol:disulfide interchange protein DsbG [Bordetella genomosp. 10]
METTNYASTTTSAVRNRYARATTAVAAVLSLTLAGVSIHAASAEIEKPAVLKTIEKEGITIVGNVLPAPKGMTGWAGYQGTQPLAFYVAPDGQVIVGTVFNAKGEDMTRGPLQSAVSDAMSRGIWGQLEKSRWIADGKATAPRVVYVFTDANCPYCNLFWNAARPWVDSGKVQLRHVMVGIITPTSQAKAAALLASADPAQALFQHEKDNTEARKAARPAGMKPLESGVKPLVDIPPAIKQSLNANLELMMNMGIRGTPGVVWRDEKGNVRVHPGVPQDLAEIFGPA